MPAIGASGVPSGGSGFVVTSSNVRNNLGGMLIYGISGRATVHFQGGFLCVAPRIRRTPGVDSGGAPAPVQDCSGSYSIDMNAFAAMGLGGTPQPALTIAGTVVDCQWWGRDPGFSVPNNSTLSSGLEYTVVP
jgi:hypothetical protein